MEDSFDGYGILGWQLFIVIFLILCPFEYISLLPAGLRGFWWESCQLLGISCMWLFASISSCQGSLCFKMRLHCPDVGVFEFVRCLGCFSSYFSRLPGCFCWSIWCCPSKSLRFYSLCFNLFPLHLNLVVVFSPSSLIVYSASSDPSLNPSNELFILVIVLFSFKDSSQPFVLFSILFIDIGIFVHVSFLDFLCIFL